jgi:SAM-dependent methyltransferase
MVRSAQCLLCGGEPTGPAYPYGTRWNGRDFDYLRCGRCGSSFLDPLPSAEDFARMYSASAYHDTYYEALDEPTPTALPAVAAKVTPGARVLDFGCGNGAFMVTARRAGFDCVGVELDPEMRARAAANSGCPVHALEEVRASGMRFDLIHLGDVLEHLPAPRETLESLRPLLAQGGSFFIEGPLEDNASLVYYASRLFGAAKRALGRNVRGGYPPYHLFRTSAAGQRRFFEAMGWTVHHYSLEETGWPYLLPGDTPLRPGSPGRLVRMTIGAAAKLGTAAGRPLGVPLGNRFAALVRPAR